MHLSILALLASVSLAMAVPFPSDHYQLTRRTYYGSDVEDDAWMHEEDDSPRLSYNAAPLSRTKSCKFFFLQNGIYRRTRMCLSWKVGVITLII